jgi:hypothetical protein
MALSFGESQTSPFSNIGGKIQIQIFKYLLFHPLVFTPLGPRCHTPLGFHKLPLWFS